jgi:hypothetical protein
MTGWMILTSLHVALTTIALVTGLRVIIGMMLGHVTSDVIPVYFSTTIVVCTTSSQLPMEAPAASVLTELVCLLSVLTAMHCRYLGSMRGAYGTAYAVAVSISLIALGVGATLQALAALPELSAIIPVLASKSVQLPAAVLSMVATALAVRGVHRSSDRDQWAGTVR